MFQLRISAVTGLRFSAKRSLQSNVLGASRLNHAGRLDPSFPAGGQRLRSLPTTSRPGPPRGLHREPFRVSITAAAVTQREALATNACRCSVKRAITPSPFNETAQMVGR